MLRLRGEFIKNYVSERIRGNGIGKLLAVGGSIAALVAGLILAPIVTLTALGILTGAAITLGLATRVIMEENERERFIRMREGRSGHTKQPIKSASRETDKRI